MVTASFLIAVRSCTWHANDYLVNGAGSPQHPTGASGGSWTLASSGLLIGATTYRLLYSATANTDGTFTSGGVRYWLHDNGSGWSVEVRA